MKSDIIVPAHRVEEIEEYYFSRKLREVAMLKESGHDIISLAIGGPDLPPDPAVIDTLCRSAHLPYNHSYQPMTGIKQLRVAYADFYQRTYGVTLDPDTEIQPLIGSKEAILQLSLTFLNPSDGVLVPNPGYPTYTSASRIVGAEIFNYDLTEENGWLPDFNQLESMPLHRIRMMWINYPNMPTGTPASIQLFERLVEFGHRHGILIVNDNPYSMILNPEPMSILSVEGARDIAIELNSLSKSHNMAGWRMAMMAARPQFIEWLRRIKSNIDSGQFKPMMLAAVEALNLPQSFSDELNATYTRRRAVAEQIMAALGCHFDPSQRGLFLWGRIPDCWSDSYRFADHILSKYEIFITPGAIFGSGGERYIRISLCAPVETLNKALNRINPLT